ncbi:MAG: hypothetical protein ACK5LY_10980 [Lachnospirales bacterium]
MEEILIKQGISNYDRLSEIFKVAIEETKYFKFVYCDYGLNQPNFNDNSNLKLSNKELGFCIGFNSKTFEIKLLPVNKNLLIYSELITLKPEDITKIEISKFTHILTIHSPLFVNKKMIFNLFENVSSLNKNHFLEIEQALPHMAFMEFLKKSSIKIKYIV